MYRNISTGLDDIQNQCNHCATCATWKNPAPTSRAPLTSIKAGHPFQLVAMDIMGLLISRIKNWKPLHTCGGRLPQKVDRSIHNQEATTVARKLTDEFFLRFSPPEQLHSDQGQNFESAVIADICKLLAIKKSRTTPYHPQSDSLVERCNRTIMSMLATAVADHPLQSCKNCMHGLQHKLALYITGYTPFYLMSEDKHECQLI